MDFELGFSKGTVNFQVDDDNLLMVMNPNPVDVEVGGRGRGRAFAARADRRAPAGQSRQAGRKGRHHYERRDPSRSELRRAAAAVR